MFQPIECTLSTLALHSKLGHFGADMGEAKQIGITIVRHSGHVLVGVRHEGQVLAGWAEFPGGKCESGEDPATCAARECLEETGIAVQPVELLERIEHRNEYGSIDLHFFSCRLVVDDAGDWPQPTNGFRWIPIAELATLSFPEANRSIVERLVTWDRSFEFQNGPGQRCDD